MNIRSPFKLWFNRWLSHRIPPQKQHTLKHRSIFIFPTKAGLGFLLLIVLLWLVGTNYQNNLVLGLAFLLLSLMVICIHHTYANLSGLQFSVVRTFPGFVGEQGRVQLKISADNERFYELIHCLWPDADEVSFSLQEHRPLTITMSVPLTKRGWFIPPRLKVSTTYPLGLIVGWSYLALDASILAYPQPVENSVKPQIQVLDDTDDLQAQSLTRGHEEFSGLREYQPGDSLRMIDWRALARGQGLASREYDDYVSEQVWLDWQQFQGLSREAWLSRLCFSVLAQSNSTSDYGLRLPNQIIQPGHGEQHQQQVLEALALFEWEQASGE